MPSIYKFFFFALIVSIPSSIALSSFAIIGLYGIYITWGIQRKKNFFAIPNSIPLKVFLIFLILNILYAFAFLGKLEPSHFRSYWRFIVPLAVFSFLYFRPKELENVFKALWIIALIMAVYGLIQFFTGIDFLRPEKQRSEYQSYGKIWFTVSAFSHHLTYGGVFLFLSFCFASLSFSKKDFLGIKPNFLRGGSALIFLSTVTCMGRSIWLGLTVGTLTLLFLYFRKYWLKILLVFGVFSILIASVTYQNQEALQKTDVGKRFLSVFSKEQNRFRLGFWEASLGALEENWFFGIGPRQYQKLDPYYEAVQKKYGFQDWQFHPPSVGVHNIYLQMWLNYGLLGVITYIAIWISLIVTTFQAALVFEKNRKQELLYLLSLGCIAAFISSMAAGFFENNFFDSEVQTCIFFFWGVALFLRQKAKEMQRHKRQKLLFKR